ncbi:MAG: hypothetical protein NTW87_26925, partial [Planctomycetota bacterium]|nr:hypothetical protein [Planctomycetota bacterium]
MRANRRSFPFGLILVSVAAACAQAAMAGGVMESAAAPREIKACILNAGGNLRGNLFIALQKAGIRPEGWRFVNPLAPPEYTDATAPFGAGAGWSALAESDAYWQFPTTGGVAATTDLHRLAGMDVIYVCAGAVNIPASTDFKENGLIRA